MNKKHKSLLASAIAGLFTLGVIFAIDIKSIDQSKASDLEEQKIQNYLQGKDEVPIDKISAFTGQYHTEIWNTEGVICWDQANTKYCELDQNLQ